MVIQRHTHTLLTGALLHLQCYNSNAVIRKTCCGLQVPLNEVGWLHTGRQSLKSLTAGILE